jgi:thiol-disulfide isomerase/thioredoxin
MFKPLEISEENENAVDIMKSNEHNKFVLYYAPWCGHCKSFMPNWNIVCEKMAMEDPTLDVKLVKVDCDLVRGNEHEKLGHNPNVNGYPTLRVYKKNSNDPDYQGEEYPGTRDPNDIMNYLSKNFATNTSGKNKKKDSKKKKVNKKQNKLKKKSKRGKKRKSKMKKVGGAPKDEADEFFEVTEHVAILEKMQDREPIKGTGFESKLLIFSLAINKIENKETIDLIKERIQNKYPKFITEVKRHIEKQQEENPSDTKKLLLAKVQTAQQTIGPSTD